MESAVVRFWRRVEVGGADECWPWIPTRDSGRYGSFAHDTTRGAVRATTSHRYSWALANGGTLPPRTLFVCHRCDNPPCCNPAHLFLGTPKENTSDMVRKGRRVAPSTANRARGDQHPSKLKPGYLPVGEHHHQAKITERDVREIRGSSLKGVELASLYGISNVTVGRIRRRLIWRHVA